jgi:hypothetical protein
MLQHNSKRNELQRLQAKYPDQAAKLEQVQHCARSRRAAWHAVLRSLQCLQHLAQQSCRCDVLCRAETPHLMGRMMMRG